MHGTLLNRASWSALGLTVAVSFGTGVGTGMIGAHLWSDPPRSHAPTLARRGERPAGASATIELEPGAFMEPGTALEGGADVAPAAAHLSARLELGASVGSGRASAPTAAIPEAKVAEMAEARAAKGVLGEPSRAVVEQVVVRRGDTLMDILERAAIGRLAAHAAVESLRALYDPRRLRAGQALRITATPAAEGEDAGARTLLELALPLSLDHEIRVTHEGEGFVAAKLDRPQERRLVRRGDAIVDSLYLSAERVAVPQDVIIDLIHMFSWDVDFQRDIRSGDEFEALFEEVSLRDGDDGAVRGGDVLYGRLRLGDREHEAFRFAPEDGEAEYFDRDGRSLRKFLLRTPIDGARMSSKFGMRRHPILGYSKMHQGVDFAAPTGTPIYAAGDGRVVVAKRHGGYGRYVKLRHTSEYDTAYAHMSRIAKGIGPGRRVRQGQVIGYVGTTGRSTGPHLHYEVIKNGKATNPLTVDQPANSQLAGAELERFGREVARIDRLRLDTIRVAQVASRAD